MQYAFVTIAAPTKGCLSNSTSVCGVCLVHRLRCLAAQRWRGVLHSSRASTRLRFRLGLDEERRERDVDGFLFFETEVLALALRFFIALRVLRAGGDNTMGLWGGDAAAAWAAVAPPFAPDDVVPAVLDEENSPPMKEKRLPNTPTERTLGFFFAKCSGSFLNHSSAVR